MHIREDFNWIKTLNCLYFRFSQLSHSIAVFNPVGLSLLLQYLLQVLLGVDVYVTLNYNASFKIRIKIATLFIY